jgi:hypothetical protein
VEPISILFADAYELPTYYVKSASISEIKSDLEVFFMKLTKSEKNQYSKLYGYGSVEQLQSDPDNKLSHWIPYRDEDGDLRFTPCTEAYFHLHRNDERNERRRKDLESRCMIPSEKFGLVKCRSDCRVCPKVRDGHPVSIDYMRETYDLEFADGSHEAERERLQEQERADLVWRLVDELDPPDQTILKLFNEGNTDAAIAEIIRKSRSMVQERRTKLIDMIKEKMKKYGN